MSIKDKLMYKKKSSYEVYTGEITEKIREYAAEYSAFLNKSKTERETVAASIELLENNGFSAYKLGDKVKAGDKLCYSNRGKSLFAFTVGSESLENGVRVCAAHVDSPRLDLKQIPLFEDSGFGYLKTHYYGGIKKYQWTAIPLALHGVVALKSGETVNIVIGEDDTDPVFCITDLLPHLGRAQMEKPMAKAITGEGLNILIGSAPCEGEEQDAVKINMMKILNDKYGIVEEDFLSAELTAVPADKARDLGLDRSLILGYGHDDRCCSYPALTALIENDSEHTVICVLADKEEIGSEGNTGMKSSLLLDLIDELSASLGADPIVVRANSRCLSADVSAGYDPLYAEVYDRSNCAMLNGGVVMMKYTGHAGKASSNDASAEYIASLRAAFDACGVHWQTAELGKVDEGGGGTVAMYIADINIDTIDLGVPVLSMHAPLEVIAKNDLYSAHLAFLAFCK
ncbi:MAG: aminopeptidase [Clostridia bacterium]|nr:aminopeptidase [Clostridia bacterium]